MQKAADTVILARAALTNENNGRTTCGLRGAEVASLVEAIWLEHESVLDRGCVLTVSGRGTRIPMLPLQ